MATNRELVIELIAQSLESLENDYDLKGSRINSKGKKVRSKDKFRDEVQSLPGQVLVWSDDDVEKSLNDILKIAANRKLIEPTTIPIKTVKKLNKELEENIWKEWSFVEKKISPERNREIRRVIDKKFAPMEGVYAAPVKDLIAARDFKGGKRLLRNAKVRTLLSLAEKEINSFIKTKRGQQKSFSKFFASRFEEGLFDIGHGTYDSLSVAQFKGAEIRRRAEEKIGSLDISEGQREDLIKEIDKVYHEITAGYREANLLTVKESEKVTVTVDWRDHKTKNGEWKEDYVIILAIEGSSFNRKKGAELEKRFFELLRNNIDSLLNLKGSRSSVESLHAALLNSLVKKLEAAKVRYKLKGSIKPNNKAVKKSTNKRFIGERREKIRPVIVNPAIGLNRENFRESFIESKNKNGSHNNTANIGVLNNGLSDDIKGAMGSPGLVNRTGRFAESVKVINMYSAAKNTIIDYTYQKDPYKVFEDTQPWATPDRDPRDLIDKVIREKAVEAGLRRFTTRRV